MTRRPSIVFVALLFALIALSPGARAFGGYETADLAPPGQWAVRVGLGAELGAGLIAAYRPQAHVRVGIAPRLDVGLGTGIWIERALTSATWLGLTGDLRYQLNRAPDVALGYTPPTIPFGGTSMGAVGLYVSRPIGTITPFGRYRATFHLTDDFDLDHHVSIGVELDNPGRIPAILALSWQDGVWVIGLAFRFR